MVESLGKVNMQCTAIYNEWLGMQQQHLTPKPHYRPHINPIDLEPGQATSQDSADGLLVPAGARML